MRRLVWAGVGVAATVVAYRKGRKVVRRYLPATLAERAETAARDVTERATAAAGDFRAIFAEARARREAELTAALLAEGQPAPGSAVGHGRDPQADDDEERLGYSF